MVNGQNVQLKFILALDTLPLLAGVQKFLVREGLLRFESSNFAVHGYSESHAVVNALISYDLLAPTNIWPIVCVSEWECCRRRVLPLQFVLWM